MQLVKNVNIYRKHPSPQEPGSVAAERLHHSEQRNEVEKRKKLRQRGCSQKICKKKKPEPEDQSAEEGKPACGGKVQKDKACLDKDKEREKDD